MLGRRFNRLGAAIRQAFNLSRVFPSGSYGGYYLPGNSAYTRQTYNAPATAAASAGDPVGLLMPAQANEAITNLLIWTDSFDNAAWNKYSACTVTANVAANPDGVPTADLLTATGADGVCSQDATVTASTTYTFSVWMKAGSATTLTIFLFTTGFATLASTVCNVTTSWQQFTVTASSGANTTIRVAIGGGSTFSNPEAVYACRAQLNLGATALDYQPNAGCLGGSNRRTGGNNLLLWTNQFNAAALTRNNVTVTDGAYTFAYNGSVGAKITRSTGVTAYFLSPYSGPAGQYTMQAKVKAATAGNYFAMRIQGTYPARIDVIFNLSTGAISSAATAFSTASGASATITSLGSSEYLVTLTGTLADAITQVLCGPCDSGSAVGSWEASSAVASDVYITQFKCEFGATATTYTENKEQLGGLLQSVVPFQGTSANRATLARRPKSGIRNLWGNTGAPTEDFTSAAWTYTAASPTANQITAPDGTLTADLITANGAASAHWFGAVTSPPVGIQTQSVYAKKGTNNYLQIAVGGSAIPYANFDLNAGTATAFGAGITATITDAGLDFPSLGMGTGWYRCQLYANDAAATNVRFAIVSSTAAARLESNSLATTVYLWGAQGDLARATASTYQKVASLYDITESGQPDVWESYYDGVSDYLDTGVQSFGTASLFAAAGQAWTVWGNFRNDNTTGPVMLVAKAATAGNSTLFVATNSGCTAMRVRCRGSINDYGSITFGQFTCWVLRWDGTNLYLYINNTTPIAVTVGGLAEESDNILVGARGASSPASFFPGRNNVSMIDRALTDAEVTQLMNYLNTTYRNGL